ncbi:MAG: HDIG domain-containing protein [Actinobacteria bacterium]|nr:MAG: HDIG domain-containing protein [Actinomycetota bacterium]
MSRAAIPSVSSGSASVSKGIVGAFRSRGRIPCPNAGPGRSCRRRRTLRFRSVTPSRDDAWELFCEWTESDSLRKHVLGVEAAMRAYAREYGEDEELWAVTGIVHDLDYERYPDLETGHPRKALEELRQLDYPEEVIDAVAGHATFLSVPRTTRMAKALYAVDELSGFVAACALVRPTGIHGMTPKSVKKKLNQPSFAASVNREEVREAAEELGVDFDEHVRRVIAAMEERAAELGLEGEAAPAGG